MIEIDVQNMDYRREEKRVIKAIAKIPKDWDSDFEMPVLFHDVPGLAVYTTERLTSLYSVEGKIGYVIQILVGDSLDKETALQKSHDEVCNAFIGQLAGHF